jgi:hypothetical protein
MGISHSDIPFSECGDSQSVQDIKFNVKGGLLPALLHLLNK